MIAVAAEVIGVACIAGFAFAIWPPAALLVFGTALLAGVWRSS